jgi:hypothetical protein
MTQGSGWSVTLILSPETEGIKEGLGLRHQVEVQTKVTRVGLKSGVSERWRMKKK